MFGVFAGTYWGISAFYIEIVTGSGGGASTLFLGVGNSTGLTAEYTGDGAMGGEIEGRGISSKLLICLINYLFEGLMLDRLGLRSIADMSLIL